MFEKGVGLVEVAGGDVGRAIEEEVDEEEAALVGLELAQPGGARGAERGRGNRHEAEERGGCRRGGDFFGQSGAGHGQGN